MRVLDSLLSGSGLPAFLTPAERASYQALSNMPPLRDMMKETAVQARARMLQGALDPATAKLLFAQADPVQLDRALGRLRGINWQGLIPTQLPGMGAVARDRQQQQQ
jgi:hypothetical protein